MLHVFIWLTGYKCLLSSFLCRNSTRKKSLKCIVLETFYLKLFAEVTSICTCTNSVNPLVNKGTGRTSTLTVQLMRCSGLSSCVMVRYARRFSSRLLSSRASSSPDWDRYLWRLQCSSNLHIQTNYLSQPTLQLKSATSVLFARVCISFWRAHSNQFLQLFGIIHYVPKGFLLIRGCW